MKLHHSLLAAALLAAVSTSAAAQSTGVVTLGGTIVPSTCTITLANGGVADVGAINSSALAQAAMTMQPSVTLALDLVCSGGTLMALTLTDNRDGTAEGNFANQLGLGLTSTNARVGRVGFAMANPMLNGAASNLIMSSNLATWVNVGAGFWDKSQSTGNKYRTLGTTAAGPAAVTTGSIDIRIDANINSRNNLMLTQDESIDGNATVELIYL